MATKAVRKPTIYTPQGDQVKRDQQIISDHLFPEIQNKRDAAIAACRAECGKVPVLVAKGTWKLISPEDLHLWSCGPDGIHTKL